MALAAMLAVIDCGQRESLSERLHQIGRELRRGIEKVVTKAGLSSYFQMRGRDYNLTYLARDQAGQPSQAFRTLVLQELIDRRIRRSWCVPPTIQPPYGRPLMRLPN